MLCDALASQYNALLLNAHDLWVPHIASPLRYVSNCLHILPDKLFNIFAKCIAHLFDVAADYGCGLSAGLKMGGEATAMEQGRVSSSVVHEKQAVSCTLHESQCTAILFQVARLSGLFIVCQFLAFHSKLSYTRYIS